MDLQPFTSNIDHPVTFINPQAPLLELLTYAGLRIRAVRDMLDSLTDMTSRNPDRLDLQRFSSVATPLLQDGRNVLHAVEQRTMDLPGEQWSGFAKNNTQVLCKNMNVVPCRNPSHEAR